MKRRHFRTIVSIFSHPKSGNITWVQIEALLISLGATIREREGSRISIELFGEIRVYHRPHSSHGTDKGMIASIRKWLEQHGVKP